MVVIASVDRKNHSVQVVKEAEKLATSFSMELHVVHVLSQSDFIEMHSESLDAGEAIEMNRIKEAAAKVAREISHDANVDANYVGLIGGASTKILEYAEEVDAEYVVIGTKKRSPTGKAVFGSTSQRIILNSNSPVITIPDGM